MAGQRAAGGPYRLFSAAFVRMRLYSVTNIVTNI
jgi:hypothetical protein